MYACGLKREGKIVRVPLEKLNETSFVPASSSFALAFIRAKSRLGTEHRASVCRSNTKVALDGDRGGGSASANIQQSLTGLLEASYMLARFLVT